jgi:hypothetical protein
MNIDISAAAAIFRWRPGAWLRSTGEDAASYGGNLRTSIGAFAGCAVRELEQLDHGLDLTDGPEVSSLRLPNPR